MYLPTNNVFPSGRLHHIGLAVSSLPPSIPSTHDSIQKVTVSFMTLGDVRYELVKPDDAFSPAARFINKGVYHLCFEVQDLAVSASAAKKAGFIVISEAVSASAFNRFILWLYHPVYGLVELLQK